MSLVWRVRINAIRIWWIIHRSKKLAKKYAKEPNMYSAQYRNDYVINKADKILKILKIKLNVKGFENIPKKATIITSNHSSSLDPLFILVGLKNPSLATDDLNYKVSFVSKVELKKSKFRYFTDLLDVAYIDRKKPKESFKIINEFLDSCKKTQKHAVIFPEGTRSKDGKIHEFKTGAFRLAKKNFMSILPVTISGGFGSTNLKERKGFKEITITFHSLIKPGNIIDMPYDVLSEKVKKIIQSDYKLDSNSKYSLNESKI